MKRLVNEGKAVRERRGDMGTIATFEFDSTDALDAVTARGLRHLLLACADTKLLLGYHYGEWTFGTPELEAAVASCSLAQAELGHVRLLHALLARHFGDEPDALIDRREPGAFANVRYLDEPIASWDGFVALNLVVDLAVTRTLHALRGSAFRPLRMSVEKMLDEERYHLHHGRGWFRTLAARDNHAALRRETARALDAVVEWFGPEHDEEDTALLAAGVKSAGSQSILRGVVVDVTALARDVGLALTAPVARDLSGWRPGNRRAGGGGPDPAILFHLRGTKNEVYKLA